ncbi:glycosyltransferase [Microbacterium terricola]|uniref:4,4'-diaponeurosporenoate glycosyltransferase n=1 Tax=Microbacterium terricola TaxID=344163 RepID=A0ABM8DVX8_9MICO|nr:glycosyltransferase [Microbacterium terricola]UYK39643.1 glycosyltransferase [Microbacterium terricola]BDV29616.1 glycosyl transferase [Microbacterium terricola]
MRSDRILAAAIVIPAHDEEDLIHACLTSVELAALAARHVTGRVTTVLVLDSCSDATAQLAADFPVEVVTIDAGRVGAARAAGVDAALRANRDVPPSRLWIAHTDADSAVPPHWLTHQLRLAKRGADVVVGTVRPDFRDLDETQTEAWWATHTPGVANGHVHGANLGTRASTLIGAGGFEDVREHEDVWLVEEMRARGARLVASDAAWVRTSGRQQGRTVGGYARYLREDLIAAAAAATQRATAPVSVA